MTTTATAEYQRIAGAALAEYLLISVPAQADDPRVVTAEAEYVRIAAAAWGDFQRITAIEKTDAEMIA